MRFTTAPSLLVALVFVLGWNAPHGLLAQPRPAAPPPLETIQIRPNVYVIFGAGANVAAHVGEDGVILVDSGSAAMADRLLASVKAITSQPIRMIINTSADADHVGGNEVLASAGMAMINRDVLNGDDHATVIAHENVLLRMSGSKGNQSPFPDGTWPDVTYTQRTKGMYLNDDAVVVMRQLGAHSDGDSMVEFRKADVFVTGDIIDLQHFPAIDPKKGGSINGELEALNRLLELTVATVPFQAKAGRTLLVPGHGRVSDYGELVEYRDMVTIVRDIIQDMANKGMTLEQVKAANPTRPFARYGSASGPWTTDMFVEAVYNGLKKPAGKS
jgi:glyoxylase-like metal-dependent hydrolase (beta-lactamase superfamily II)